MGEILAEIGGYAPYGATGLLMVVVLMIFRGNLVPSRYYDEVKADRDKWQAISEKATEANDQLLEQNGELIKAGLTTQKVLESLPPGGS